MFIRREAETSEEFAGARGLGIAVASGELFVRFGNGVTVAARFGGSDSGKGSLVGGVSGEDVVMGAVGQRRGFLGDAGDAPVRRQAVVAAVGFEVVAQEGEQGAFAAAVATGEADALAGVNAGIGVFDEVFAVARQGEVVEFDHGAVSHCMPGSSPSACGKR